MRASEPSDGVERQDPRAVRNQEASCLEVVGRCSHCDHQATIREREQKCAFCGEWEWIVAHVVHTPPPAVGLNPAVLHALIAKWRREAADEQRVSFHGDELEATIKGLARVEEPASDPARFTPSDEGTAIGSAETVQTSAQER